MLHWGTSCWPVSGPSITVRVGSRRLSGIWLSCGNDVDLLFANLEVTLPGTDGEIEKQPRLVGTPEVIDEALRILDVDLLNLSNNHAFDCFDSGFETVCDLLRSKDLGFWALGLDASGASRPLILDRNGIRLGWLAYTAWIRCPRMWRVRDGYGVNAFASRERWRISRL